MLWSYICSGATLVCGVGQSFFHVFHAQTQLILPKIRKCFFTQKKSTRIKKLFLLRFFLATAWPALEIKSKFREIKSDIARTEFLISWRHSIRNLNWLGLDKKELLQCFCRGQCYDHYFWALLATSSHKNIGDFLENLCYKLAPKQSLLLHYYKSCLSLWRGAMVIASARRSGF
jgi:hypothetical protein